MNFLFSSNFEVGVELDGHETRTKTEVKIDENKKESQYVYYDGETVSGKVQLTFKKSGTKLDHQGIKIEFVGQIELFNDKNNRHEFTSLVRELANPGEILQNTNFSFEFIQVEKPYETYYGTNAKLNYFLRVTVVKRLSDVVKEIPITVHTLAQYPETNTSIKMEVGIEDCLHIEFEYNKSKYYLTDVIVGKIYFILVRLKVKHMEIQIIKREIVGSETNSLMDNEVITKFEIMDGLPVRGESIPIRLFLSGYDLTPSMKDINKKFSVRYYINLVLVDEEDRRYFKQQEITLFRKLERQKRSAIQKTPKQQNSNRQTSAVNNNNEKRGDKMGDDDDDDGGGDRGVGKKKVVVDEINNKNTKNNNNINSYNRNFDVINGGGAVQVNNKNNNTNTNNNKNNNTNINNNKNNNTNTNNNNEKSHTDPLIQTSIKKGEDRDDDENNNNNNNEDKIENKHINNNNNNNNIQKNKETDKGDVVIKDDDDDDVKDDDDDDDTKKPTTKSKGIFSSDDEDDL